MRWPWGRTQRFILGDIAVSCPDCGSSLPAASVLVLRSWVLRDGELRSFVTGERVACQAHGCGSVYSIGPNGPFRHSATAQPYTPSFKLEQALMDKQKDDPQPAMKTRTQWPMAKQKPNT